MEFMTNYGVSSNVILMYNLCNGVTDYHFTKFHKDLLLENMVKCKVSANSYALDKILKFL